MEFNMLAIALILSLSLLLPASSLAGTVICENLPQNLCSLSISGTGERCVLESYRKSGESTMEYYCKTSEVEVEWASDWIETDECVKACGVDRMAVGISSDSLLDSQSTAMLCSPACYHNCPNVVDLYFNLAAGEGVFLPDLCEARRSNPHRSMVELVQSSGLVSPLQGDIDPSPAPSAQ
ncbi:uncharacterized protein LOC110022952 [Phalaenopsis equestris]|uniref:uncharacterized protein LOC110022952 n=1 Tax=Phalaenopsis equestris TaxID=78828 RepID=UPI0009E589BC|nr:uncharacterized protein LOC110022952 [Phalaenopsis equestris]